MLRAAAAGPRDPTAASRLHCCCGGARAAALMPMLMPSKSARGGASTRQALRVPLLPLGRAPLHRHTAVPAAAGSWHLAAAHSSISTHTLIGCITSSRSSIITTSSSSSSSSSSSGSVRTTSSSSNDKPRRRPRLAQPPPCRAAASSGATPAPFGARLPPALAREWPLIARLAATVLMVAVIRAGYFVPLPGVDAPRLAAAAAALARPTEGERIMRCVYGQASELPASLFDLGISPHVNASILVSVLLLLPKELFEWGPLDRLREARKEGKSGEAEINGVINNAALVLAIWAAFSRARELLPYALLPAWFVPQTTLALVAGAFMVHHCANAVTAAGVGNGSTLVICMGIVTEYADAMHAVFTALEAAALPPLRLAAALALYAGLVLFAVYLSSAEVRLPVVQYSSTPPQPPRGGGAGGGAQGELFAQARAMLDKRAAAAPGAAAYFPVKLNSSGIMPMIIASAGYYGLLPRALELAGAHAAAAGLAAFQATGPGLLVYGALVFAMEFLPFGAVNPAEVSEYFSAINVGIKGVAPGKYTVDYLTLKVRQCKFWGGAALGGLAVAAHAFDALCRAELGVSLATTSLVIIVGAVLQTSRQVAALREGPALERRLDQERVVIRSLAG